MRTDIIVKEISSISRRGLSVPFCWFSEIKTPAGKPDLIGIIILSDVLYWYSWEEVRDHQRGNFIRFQPKFPGQWLEKSYADYEKQFSFSEKQIKSASDRLDKAGLIKKKYRRVTGGGCIISWIPIPSQIRKIMFDKEEIPGNDLGLEDKQPKPEKKDYSGIPSRVIAKINNLSGKNYTVAPYLDLIKARLNEGRTEKDFNTVIENMYAAWGHNDEYSQYVRPATLFKSAKKFDSYLNWKNKKKREEKKGANLFDELS